MEGGDPNAHRQKRPRLDSVNPVHNDLTPSQNHHHHHQTDSPPPHSAISGSQGSPLPPSPQAQPRYPPRPPQPPLSIQASETRVCSDTKNISSSIQRTHGVNSLETNHSPHAAQPTSVSLNSNPPLSQCMEYGVPPSPWSMSPEQHRHHINGSISNGYSHQALSPPNPNLQPFSPPMGQEQASNGQPVDTYAPGHYMNQVASIWEVPIKKKRATQACNNCRSRKQRCDEKRPCESCREEKLPCEYKEPPLPKQERSVMQVQDSVNSISDTLKSFVEGFNTWKHSVESRLPPSKGSGAMQIASSHASPEQSFGVRGSMSEQSGSRIPTPVQGRAQIRRVNSMKTESPVAPHSNISPIPPHASTPIKRESILVPQQPSTPTESVCTDHTRPLDDPSMYKSGFQSDHTTSAHHLLEEWPSMKTFH
ncbi:hypothetical protein BS50DRAFT_647092, partial [Corynespora cassiicola Philippines]